jgi:DNA-directed RNA polymerase subunit M/transcription elongation factor TFIIS
MICSKKGQKFAVHWEEEPSTKRHVAVSTEKIEPHIQNLPSAESKNLRPSSEIICPHCGNQHVILCMKCKMFMCYDGVAQKLKCPTCKVTYGLKDQVGGDIDIKTL